MLLAPLEIRKQRSREIVRRHYHDKGWRSPYARYRDEIVSELSPGQAVLDVGCGRTFPEAKFLMAAGARAYGLDPVADASAVPEGAVVRKGGAESIPFESEMFDVVISCAVLEHLQQPEEVFAELQRVLKPGGRVVFLTPAKYDYVSVLARIIPNALHGKLVKATEGRDEADTFPTFYRANTIRQIRRLASTAGLSPAKLTYVNQFPYALSFSPLLCRLGILYDAVVTRVRCLHWLQAWLLGVLRKGRADR